MAFDSIPQIGRKQLDRRLTPLRKMQDLARPPRGWIKAIREALGLTTAQLGFRIGVSQPRIAQLERAEVEDRVTLRTLREVADGLGCTLVYALVPKVPLDDMVRARARDVADDELTRTEQTMRLENQALGPREQKAECKRIVDELMRGDPRRLWKTP